MMQISQRQRQWLPFAVAMLIFAAAAGLRLVFLPVIGTRIPYVTFFPAVMFAALLGGLYAGLIATLLSTCFTAYFLIPPVGSLSGRDLGDWLGIAIFLLSGLMVSLLSERTRRAQRQVSEAEAQVQLSTAREQASAALRQSEARFRSYVENSPIAVFVVDREGRYRDFNPAASVLLGYPADTLACMHILEVHPIEDHQRVLVKLATLFETGQIDVETRMLRGDGRTVWVSLHAAVLESGHAIAYCQDITELREAVASMRERLELQEQLATITAVVPGMIHSFRRRPDGSCCFPYASPAMVSIFGLQPAQVALDGTPALELIHPEDKEQVSRSIAESARSMTPWHQECRVKHPLRGEIWIEVHSIPHHEPDGGILWQGFTHDITARKRLETQLLQAQKMEAVGRLAGGVAHDFNNNLTVILGYAELSKVAPIGSEKLQEHLDEIIKAAEHSRDITQQLLAFSRNEVIAPRRVDLNLSIRHTERALSRLIGEDVCLRLNTPEGIWPVLMDPTQINQIVLNLAANARDAMPDGGTLSIETKNVRIDEICRLGNTEPPPGEYVRLTVSDTGVGIEREDQARIFEPFFTTKGIAKGTGLGLATVYGIMCQNRGFIKLYSEPRQGASFSLFFPRLEPGEDVRQAEPQAVVEGDGCVLLVEDEETVRRMSQLMLEKRGFSVLVAASPREALEICRRTESRIDCLLTDVIMPEMNGVELAAAVRAIRPGIGMVYMSGYTADMIAQHGVLDPGVIFVQKPFDVTRLAQKVQQAIQASRPLPDGKSATGGADGTPAQRSC